MKRLQDFDEAEQQAKQKRVADAELAATQVWNAALLYFARVNKFAYLLVNQTYTKKGV